MAGEVVHCPKLTRQGDEWSQNLAQALLINTCAMAWCCIYSEKKATFSNDHKGTITHQAVQYFIIHTTALDGSLFLTFIHIPQPHVAKFLNMAGTPSTYTTRLSEYGIH